MKPVLALLAALLLAPLAALSAAEPARPNILFILADDLGWGDLRCHGNPHVDTPALNGLAKAGVRFTDHYSPSPLCAPARASYRRGLVHPHWEMPLDRQLDPPTTAPRPPPRLYDLEADPSEQHDLASAHPDLVAALTRKHDAWFGGVVADWEQSRARIVEHDRSYWKGRPVPDPALLFERFWLWQTAPKGTDPTTANPLNVFRGFWSNHPRDQ